MALLEVLIAVAILGIAALSSVQLLLSSGDAAFRTQRAEADLAGADRLLTGYSLLSATDLQQRLGDRVLGDFRVKVERITPVLYRIRVEHAHVSGARALETVVYRPGGDL